MKKLHTFLVQRHLYEMVCFTAVLLFYSLAIAAQPDLKEFEKGAKDGADTIVRIALYVVRAAASIGVVILVYNLVTGNQTSRNQLVYFLVAMIVWGIAEAII